MAKKKIKRKYKSKYKKYATAGMYNDNTIQASGQQSAGQTANIVFDESNPQVLAGKMEFLKQTKEDAMRSSEEMANQVEQQKEIDKQNVALAEQKVQQKFQQGEQLLSKGKKAVEKVAGQIAAQKAKNLAAEKAAKSIAGEGFGNLARQKSAEEVSKILSSQTAQKGAELSLSGASGGSSSLLGSFGGSAVTPGVTSAGTTLGTEAAKTAGTELAKTAGTEVAKTAGTEVAKTVGTQAAKQGIGAGLKSFATSGAGIGTIASIAGTGIKMLSDDNDPTKSNFGEYSGAVLSAAGTGASIGSVIPGIGTAIGAGIGAIYGGVKQFLGTRAAKREAQKLREERIARADKYNQELNQKLLAANASARAGELEQKTYSGYDLGRNITAKFGGMRMGTPRYGFSLA
jgi:hypothetical protein